MPKEEEEETADEEEIADEEMPMDDEERSEEDEASEDEAGSLVVSPEQLQNCPKHRTAKEKRKHFFIKTLRY